MAFLAGLFSAKGLGIAAASAAGIYFTKKHTAGPEFNSAAVGADMKGKNVIITGANTGIGLESAIEFANLGANVIIACRDEKRATEALATIRSRIVPATAVGGTAGRVEFMPLDLSDLNSVRKFTAEYKSKYDALHVLLNNAGIMMCPEWKTAQKVEMQFGTNHLGHFVLTNGLLDVLKSSAPSRIVNVSSNAHQRASIDLDDLEWTKRKYDSIQAYGASKLANILFTEELSRRLAGTGVTAYALHPGWIRNVVAPIFAPVIWLLMKDAKAGAQTNLYCSMDKACAKESGLYYSDSAVFKSKNPQVRDAALAAKLWQISEKLSKL